VIHRTAALRRPSILTTVEVRMDGDLRDVRTSPESPAPWPDELSNPVLSLLAPFKFPFFFNLAGNGPNGPFHPPFWGHWLLAIGH
jgi:hypothetical protein